MRQFSPAHSFRSLLTWLIMMAVVALVLLTAFNPATWLRGMRLSLPAGIHSPLYADYSADLHGILVAPADVRLLAEALAAQQANVGDIINDLLTPVPTVTPQAGAIQPTLPVVVVTPSESGPTATLPPGVTPTLTWTPTLTFTPSLTWTATLTRTVSVTPPGGSTRTPGPSATLPPWTPTATFTATATHTSQPTPTHTPTRTPGPTATPTDSGYPPPATPPGYP